MSAMIILYKPHYFVMVWNSLFNRLKNIKSYCRTLKENGMFPFNTSIWTLHIETKCNTRAAEQYINSTRLTLVLSQS